MFRALCRSALLTTFLLACPAAARATVISFQAVDLEDAAAGLDLWQYRYVVSDRVFAPFEGFSIFFDPLLAADVNPLVAAPDDAWDVLVLLPGSPGDGHVYDALALQPGASLDNEFVVNFVRAPGAGGPGPQSFAVNAFDEDLNFLGVLENGTTVPAPATSVPEPGTLLLVGAGVAAATLTSRRSHRR